MSETHFDLPSGRYVVGLGGCVYGVGSSQKEAETNAKKRAAADELYEALVRILNERSVCSSLKCQSDGHAGCRYAQAIAALKKARGEA